MLSISSDNLNLKLENGMTVPSIVKKKLTALKNVLYYIKTIDNCEQKHLIKSKQKAVKMFSKVLKIIRKMEIGKNENITDILDKKLPKRLMNLKTKSLVYHLEAIFVENLLHSICNEGKSRKTQSIPKIVDRCTKFKTIKKEENFGNDKHNFINEIDNYVKYFLINIGTIETQTILIKSLIIESVAMSEINLYLKQEADKIMLESTLKDVTLTQRIPLKSEDIRETITLYHFKHYSSQNNNSSESSKKSYLNKWKHYTTFLSCNNANRVHYSLEPSISTDSINYELPSCKKRNIYLKIKDLKERYENKINFCQKLTNCNNKENIEDMKTVDECNLSWNDLSSSKRLIEDQTYCYNKLDEINNATHSISDVHVLLEKDILNKATESHLSNIEATMNGPICGRTIDMEKNDNQAVRTFVKYDLPSNIRCTRIINAAIQSAKLTNCRADIALRFVNSNDERIICLKNMQNISSFEIKPYVDGDNCSTYTVGVKFTTISNEDGGIQHEFKIKHNRVIKQIIMVPNIVCRYLSDTNSKKDHRIIHIEQFCNCKLSFKNKFNIYDKSSGSSKTNILVNIIYDMEKGNEIGCLNMIKRMLKIFQFQLKIIREFKITVDGRFEETIYK